MEIKLKGLNEYTVASECAAASLAATVESSGGIDCVKIVFTSETPVKPPVVKVHWEKPHVDVQGIWHPTRHLDRTLPPVWGGYWSSDSACGAPVAAMFSSSGKNRQTFACSDAINPVKFRYGLREENSVYLCDVKLCDGNLTPCERYEATIRVDMRDIRWEDSLRDVSDWWAAMPEYKPMPIFPECVSPLYSTWYSFHQMAFGDEIEEVLRSCAPLGFSSVIVDDGWQMADYSRTYNWCGDWEVAPEKIADMKKHVAAVHALGMKYFLWYSVPFVGKNARAYNDFKGKFLGSGDVVCFDPRYPDVREYLISCYERAIREWDIDGFKLDFIDAFRQPAEEAADAAPGKDTDSVPVAVDRLMTDVQKRLCALKPNLCIEFRQAYVGPLMRKYANMFRAGDCANDTIANRVRTIDIHLGIGGSPVHADMLTWHPDDTPEAAALQLIATAFAVPQISVRPYNLPESHNTMLKNWLTFWKENRDTLLFGKFRAHNPDLLYSQASAESDDCFIAAAYANRSVMYDAERDVAKRVFLNGSGEAGLALDVKPGRYNILIEDCLGNALYIGERDIDGLCGFDVPVAGRITLTK